MGLTPKGRITSTLRQLWLRSAEREEELKRDRYTCVSCGAKQSRAKGKEQKVEVHHIQGIEWDEIVDLIYQEILCDVDKLQTLCPDCHNDGTR